MSYRWVQTIPEGATCAFTGLRLDANGPYCQADRFYVSAGALREIAAAEASPFVLTPKDSLEKLNASLAERVEEFNKANERIKELEGKLARRRKRTGDGD